jgi:hypothetical protein
MIIYKCRFTEDEMCSDAFKPQPVMDGDEVVPGLFEIESQKVNKDSGAKVDIGCGGEFGGGESEPLDDTVELVNNVIDDRNGFDLQEVPLRKKDFKEYLKEYCKNVRQKLKEDPSVEGPQVKAFTAAAPDFCKWLLSKYDDLQFYSSSTMDPEGSMVFSYYKEGAVNPTFVYIAGGLKEEKC